MRIISFGIYGAGLNALKRMAGCGIEVAAVVTKPSTESDPQPVAEWAHSRGMHVLAPTSPTQKQFIDSIRALSPDLIVVCGYHKILPAAILDIPTWGTINAHGSLLPKYRGPNPHKWAIIKGEKFTGATVHIMTPRFDDGDILAQRIIPIAYEDTGGALFNKISAVSADLVVETIAKIETGAVERTPQDESMASYFSYPTDADRTIDWAAGAEAIYDLIRGLSPRSPAITSLNGKGLDIWKAQVTDVESTQPLGSIIDWSIDGIRVATATRDLIIQEITFSDGSPWRDTFLETRNAGEALHLESAIGSLQAAAYAKFPKSSQ